MSKKVAHFFSKLFGGAAPLDDVISKSVNGLAESVTSILGDTKLNEADMAKNLTATFEQFEDHLKKNLAAGPAVTQKGESDMDIAILRKALGLADTATEADVTKALAKQRNDAWRSTSILKADFTVEEMAFYNKASEYDEEEEDEEGDGDPKGKGKKAKKIFRMADHAKRAEIMKAAAPDPSVPPWAVTLQKSFEAVQAENVDLKKRLDAAESTGSLASFAKRAHEAGLAEAEAVTLQKLAKADPDAAERMLGFVKTANAAARAAGVFKELGGAGNTTGPQTAMEELQVLAKELRKKDTTLTPAKAFAKVYEDPANIEIVQRERAENRPSAA